MARRRPGSASRSGSGAPRRDAAWNAGRGGRGGGRRRTQSATQRHFTMANLAGYPAINLPNGFGADGQPTNVMFYARPFGEAELLALAKAYQDVAGFHLHKPAKLDHSG